jgi:hypothetical protein
MDATINIGLGTGSRDRDMAMLNQILNVQMAMTDRFAQGGFSEQALEMVPKINMTATKLAESAGIKNPDQFYLDIKPEMLEKMKQQAAQPKPDPAMIKIQADTQIKQAELQQRDKEMFTNAQLAQQADERKAGIEQVQMQADIEAQDRKTQAEMVQSQQDFEFKKELALMQFQSDRELKLMDHQLKREAQQEEMQMKREQHQQQMESGVFKSMQSQEAHQQKMEHMNSAPQAGE